MSKEIGNTEEIIKPTPRVVAIHIRPREGEPMESREEVELTKGAGITGDRYPGIGHYTDKRIPNEDRGITLISLQAINLANKYFREHCDPGFRLSETRRNFTVSIDAEDLRSLIGSKFSIAGVELLGTDECTPCVRPGELLGMEDTTKQMFVKAFVHSGGIRARVLSSGIISVRSELIRA